MSCPASDAPDDDGSFRAYLEAWNQAQGQPTPALHGRMADWLDARWAAGDRELLLLAFRGSGKSTVAGLFSAWRLTCDPDTRVLVLSAEEKLAARMVRTVKRVVETHPASRHLKPDKPELWGALAFTVDRPQVGRDASMTARGILANVTGAHADLVICDDVEVPNTCDTDVKRADLRERLLEIPSILTPGGTVMYIGTPHTWASIYAEVQRREDGAEPPFLDGFVRHEIPVLDMGGESAWPERYTPQEIDRLRLRLGPNRFGSQMMLRPTAPTDVRLDPGLITFYDDELEIREAAGFREIRIGGRPIMASRAWWDPALGSGDGSVVAVLYDGPNGHVFLHRIVWLDVPPGDPEPARTQCRQVAALLRDLPVDMLHVETNGLGTFLPEVLKTVMKQEGLGHVPCPPGPASRPR